MVVRPPLGMPDDDVVNAQVFKHRRGDLAGIGTLMVRAHVLGSQLDGAARQRPS